MKDPKKLYPRFSEAHQENVCPLDKDLAWRSRCRKLVLNRSACVAGWNSHFQDIQAYEQKTNSRQHCVNASSVKNCKSKMEFHGELQLARRVCRIGAPEKRRGLNADGVLEIHSIEDIESIHANFQPWSVAFATSFTQVGETPAHMSARSSGSAASAFISCKRNPL